MENEHECQLCTHGLPGIVERISAYRISKRKKDIILFLARIDCRQSRAGRTSSPPFRFLQKIRLDFRSTFSSEESEMNWFRCMVASIIVLILLIVSTCAFAGEPKSKCSKEELTEIELLLGKQQSEIQQQFSEKMYWFDQYRDLKNCIRESVKNNTPASLCIGDTES